MYSVEAQAVNMVIVLTVICFITILFWVSQAALAAALAKQKGYSAAAGFVIALAIPFLGLIYQAGRPVSQELEDERQRALAARIAKALKKSEQPQEKADEGRRRFPENR